MTEASVELPTEYQQFIHLSRYSRWLADKKRRESWPETVKRYFDFFEEHLKDRCDFILSNELRAELESAVLCLEVMPSMRALMTAGEALKRDEVAGFNCSAVYVDNPKAFDEIMMVLMCGVGAGFSVERQFVNKLPEIAEEFYGSDSVIVVPDSKIGWAKSLRELISMLYVGQVPKWDLSKIRPAGAPLKVFGGRASGPLPLDRLFNFIVKIFKNAKGRKLSSIECHDICCKIAEVIVVGGVRRSALISLSNLSDDRMRSAKSGQWWLENQQRALANNSTAYTEKPDIGILMDEFKSLYESRSGERGIFNRQGAKKHVEKNGRREVVDFITNPCCVTGDTKILTDKGHIAIQDLVGIPVNVWNGHEFSKVVPFESGYSSLMQVSLSNGVSIKCTPNHKFVMKGTRKTDKTKFNDEYVMVKDLVIGSSLQKFDYPAGENYPDDIKVVEIESIEPDFTYCFDEPKNHTGTFNGVVTGQSEVLLRSKGLCNLSEVILRPNDTVESVKKKIRIATILGTFQSTLTNFRYLSKQWKVNAEEERLLGVSLTGIFDNKFFSKPSKELEKTLTEMKEYAVSVNKEFSEQLKIPQSVAVTCTKPSGCQTKDHLLLTSDGILTLEEIGNNEGNDNEWQEHSLRVAGEHGINHSTKFYRNGYGPIIRLKMRSGIELKATPNHKFKVFRSGVYDWIDVNDICDGDIIPYVVGGYCGGSMQNLFSVNCPKCNAKDIKMPHELTEDFAWLLGFYFADGSTHHKGIRINGGHSKLQSLNRAKKIASDLFQIEGKIYENGSGVVLYLNSKHLLAYLSANNLIKEHSIDLKVPVIIRKSPASVIKFFYEGFLAGDGNKTTVRPSFVTTSKKFAEEMVVILRAIGTDCSVRKMPPTESSLGNNMRYWVQENAGRKGNYKKSRYFEEYNMLDEMNLSHLTPDVVVGITPDEDETFDIEIPDKHEYLSNSYVSHNTVSQLCNSSSGIHPRHSQYYVRTVRADNKDPLCKLMKELGFPNEPDVTKPDHTTVFSFPVKSDAKTIFRDNLSVIDHLELWLAYKKYWAEHTVSITVSVRENEWFDVFAWVYKHFDDIIGVSFLPYSDHVYQQAPYQECNKEQYEDLLKKIPKNVDWSQLSKYEESDQTTGVKELACVSGVCEI